VTPTWGPVAWPQSCLSIANVPMRRLRHPWPRLCPTVDPLSQPALQRYAIGAIGLPPFTRLPAGPAAPVGMEESSRLVHPVHEVSNSLAAHELQQRQGALLVRPSLRRELDAVFLADSLA